MVSEQAVTMSELLARIGRGECWSVFIDDTGPGGTSSTPATLPHDRASYVAVLFSPENGSELIEQMPGVLEELHGYTGATEFHFAEIYSGKKPWREVPIKLRCAAFEFMAEIFEQHSLPVLVQSIDSALSKRVLDEFGQLRVPSGFPFRVDRHADLALFFLLQKVRDFLQQQEGEAGPAITFIDEGWKKHGTVVQIPLWEDFLDGGRLTSSRSDVVPGLQFADFAAFMLNRSQLILGRDSLNEMDQRLLPIVSRLSERFVNLPSVDLKVEGDSSGVRLRRFD